MTKRQLLQRVAATIEREYVDFRDCRLKRVSNCGADAGELLMSNGPPGRHTEARSCSSARAKAPAGTRQTSTEPSANVITEYHPEKRKPGGYEDCQDDVVFRKKPITRP